MATPEAYEVPNASSIDGMDTIFDTNAIQSISAGIQSDTNRIPPVSMDSTENPIEVQLDTNESTTMVTVTEAARILGVPYTTFYRHVRAGKYRTCQGSDGKLRVLLTEADNHQASSNTVDTGEQDFSVHEESIEARSIQADTFMEIFRQQAADSESTRKELKEAQQQLQAANCRIGYLESQVENHTDTIKLLTDSQRNRSWWSKFCSWMGGRSE